MGLRFDPVGGGQFKQAVQQIIEAERQPIKSLEARKVKEDTRLKTFQEFKSKFSGLEKALNEISTFRKFRELKVDLGDAGNLISVTLDKERAEPGQYTLEVDELASRTSSISNGFDDPDQAVLGPGFVTLSFENGDTSQIYIDDDHSSLRGIAGLMNKNSSFPVRASVIKDDADPATPWKLLLTGRKDGKANQVDIPEFYFTEGDVDLYIDDDKEAQNATLTLDGFPIESGSNDLVDFFPGVNIHLKQARPDQPFTITISEDVQKISGKMKTLVDQCNQILGFISKQNSVDEHTDTSTTLTGDTNLQSVEYSIRNLIHNSYLASDLDDDEPIHTTLNQLGIEFDKNGQLTFKEDKFNKSVEKNFDGVAHALTGPAGFVSQMRALFEGYSRSGSGLLSIKEKALRSRIKQIDEQIENKNRLLDRRKQDLVDKFSRLEATLGDMQRQQQYLSAVLPGGGGGNMVSQLLGG